MRILPALVVCCAAAAAAFADEPAALAVLRAGCAADAQQFCANVPPGGGRILACLRDHKDELSDQCKQAAVKAQVLSSNSAPAPAPAPAPARAPRLGRVGMVGTLGVLALVAASLGRQYVAVLYGNSGQALVSSKPLAALDRLRTAEQLDPWSMQTQYSVASAYARLNDYGAARAALLDAEALEPENDVPPALLGDIATRAGDRRTALADYRRALALDPLEPALKQAVQTAEAGRR